MRHKSGFKPEITPGMPLSVNILGYEPTVMNYIGTPIKNINEINILETVSLG